MILPAPAVIPVCPSPAKKIKYGYNEELLELKSHFVQQGIFQYAVAYMQKHLYAIKN